MSPADDDSYLDDIFDLSVRRFSAGEPLDIEGFAASRPHLRNEIVRLIGLAREVAVSKPPLTEESAPPSIAGFTLLEEAGRGGVGIVYRARQESLGRIVALKILSPALVASRSSRERFAVEARALGRVRHPNVVRVHDVVVTDTVCAFSMDWIEGSTLAAAIGDGLKRLEVGFVARIGASIARALAAVHGAGLVHRDVKPGNILLQPDGPPMLSDFSLVRDDQQRLHTATGEFIGTAAYAAPEQLRGDQRRVGPHTDVYGLGVTLYTALTGTTPFGMLSNSETLSRIENGLWKPLRAVTRGVPRDLETIVAKAMDPNPERRYRSATDLADDLDRFLRFEPVRARKVGVLIRLARLARRNRIAFSAAIAASAVMFAAAVAVGWWWRNRLEIPDRFREHVRQARLAILDPAMHKRIWVSLNADTEALDAARNPVEKCDLALKRYDAALALARDHFTEIERDTVAAARSILARDTRSGGPSEALRSACPRTCEVADGWRAAGRASAVLPSVLVSASLFDRRHLGLMAFLCAQAGVCMAAWEPLDADPALDDPLVSGAVGLSWLAIDRPAHAALRLARARREFPEARSIAIEFADALIRSRDILLGASMLEVAKGLPEALGEDSILRLEADLAAGRGDFQRALALYRSAPMTPTCEFHFARALLQVGETDAAVKHLQGLLVSWQKVERYRVLLLETLEPSWQALDVGEKANVVVAAAHGAFSDTPVAAIAEALRERRHDRASPVRRSPVTWDSLRLSDLRVTPLAFPILQGDEYRRDRERARRLASLALCFDLPLGRKVLRYFMFVDVDALDWPVQIRPQPQAEALKAVAEARQTVNEPRIIAAAGDLDRDGAADVIVGDPTAQGGNGAAWVASGKTGRVLFRFTGLAGSRLGLAVAGGRDLNGDGVLDLLIAELGRLRILSGAGGLILREVDVGDAVIAPGRSVAIADDLDRDGAPDVVTASFGDSCARAFSSRTGELIRDFRVPHATGSRIACGHDADGDGVGDVLVGEPNRRPGDRLSLSRVTLFSGATGSILWQEALPFKSQGFGASIAFVGDQDGDGLDDWAVGAPADLFPFNEGGRGFVRVFAGPHGKVTRTIGGCGLDAAAFGSWVSPGPDRDGDGIPDLLIAGRTDLSGTGDAWVTSWSGRHDLALRTRLRVEAIPCSIDGSLLVADFDGDGTLDLAASAPGEPGFRVIPVR